jgi:hypothetical protein
MMIATRSVCWILALAWSVSPVSGQTPAVGAVNTSSSSDYSIVQRLPHSRLWQRTLLSTNALGMVRTNVQSYSELATGICYLANGQYVDSVEQVNSVPGGA